MKEAELLALIRSMPECEQSSHFGTMDFRVRNKIFCTHSKPGELVLKLTREQQQMLVEAEPAMFRPIPNRWGLKGWTAASVSKLDETSARSALRMAWESVAPKSLREGSR
jgi:hypothetical protein